MIDPLKTRRLGRSELQVTQLGLGCAPLGDLYSRIPETEALGVLQEACDAGLRLFDTSPFYGYGLSEQRVGQVLRQQPRDGFILSTKVGRWLRPERPERIDRGQWTGGLDFQPVFDYSHDGVMREVDQSMQRLGLSRIDILLIHDADVWTHGDQAEQRFREAMDGAYVALDRLRAEGAVSAIGVGINESATCARFLRAGDFDCALLAGRYTLLDQSGLDEVLPLCVEKDVGLLLGGPFNSGILATGDVTGAKFHYRDPPDEVKDRVRRLQAVMQRHGIPLAAAAIQFPFGHPKIGAVIPGAASADEVRSNIELMSVDIPAALWDELKAENLIRADALVPG